MADPQGPAGTETQGQDATAAVDTATDSGTEDGLIAEAGRLLAEGEGEAAPEQSPDKETSGDAQDPAAQAVQDDPEYDLGDGVGKARASEIRAWREAHGKVTQDLQTIAKMRKDLEPAMILNRELRGNQDLARAVVDLVDKGRRDPGFIARVAASMRGEAPPVSVPKGDALAPMVEQMNRLATRLDRFEKERATTQADLSIKQEYDEIRSSHPELKQMGEPEWRSVAAEVARRAQAELARGRDIPLKYIYADMSKSGAVKTALEVGIQKGIQDAAKRAAAPAPKVKGGAGTPPPRPKGPMSRAEEEDFMLQELRKAGVA